MAHLTLLTDIFDVREQPLSVFCMHTSYYSCYTRSVVIGWKIDIYRLLVENSAYERRFSFSYLCRHRSLEKASPNISATVSAISFVLVSLDREFIPLSECFLRCFLKILWRKCRLQEREGIRGMNCNEYSSFPNRLAEILSFKRVDRGTFSVATIWR